MISCFSSDCPASLIVVGVDVVPGGRFFRALRPAGWSQGALLILYPSVPGTDARRVFQTSDRRERPAATPRKGLGPGASRAKPDAPALGAAVSLTNAAFPSCVSTLALAMTLTSLMTLAMALTMTSLLALTLAVTLTLTMTLLLTMALALAMALTVTMTVTFTDNSSI